MRAVVGVERIAGRPASFATLGLALFVVAFDATLVPALGALRIAPMVVLRQE
jgi:hypothetical protein